VFHTHRRAEATSPELAAKVVLATSPEVSRAPKVVSIAGIGVHRAALVGRGVVHEDATLEAHLG
jgi:hypothetical protein